MLALIHGCRMNVLLRRLTVRNLFVCNDLFIFQLLNHKIKDKTFVNKLFSTSLELTIANPIVNKYLDYIMNEYKKGKHNSVLENIDLRVASHLLESRQLIIENIEALNEMIKQDPEMKKLADEEQSTYKAQLLELDNKLLDVILLNLGKQGYNDIVLEITAGVGGQEAMLFAAELFDMYLGYIYYLGFTHSIAEQDISSTGGIRHASILISGEAAFDKLKYEGGVHRVQRIPYTEKSGRVHTSTVSVAVLPQVSEIEVALDEKDLKIETKRASGAGGQHVNTTDSAVRILHIPTGIAVECQSDRSQLKNKETALTRLRTKIYEKQLNEQMASTSEMRRRQMGLGNRNEKIRTYNYNQDRITDHRISNGTLHNLKGFLQGGEALEDLQMRLQDDLQKNILLEAIKDVERSSK
ncbi:peptide chain release factor 1-like, mitochondrial [Cephus cinctus]|uniref:Peptide chain release factor 1-like, mitochondrial n=1 Tax=Cephus cinctus TaxID=211228 RepID=A0AAJ7VYG9_CEPCN|nr:peptide chain release factor 1-like, mitochondrial [Cephus cinctus]XP_024937761.1 peptide chain release factor 1-like, mitochondrial [Cephus cinctus]